MGRPCFEVEFGDGTVIVADGGHQWITSQGLVTTAHLAVIPGIGGHAVDVARPAELPDRDLPVPPYALGVLLGDETGQVFTGDDSELILAVEAAGVGDARRPGGCWPGWGWPRSGPSPPSTSGPPRRSGERCSRACSTWLAARSGTARSS